MSDSRLCVLTLNIAHGRGLSPYQGLHSASVIERNLQRIVRLLQREQPDIVALQEVDADSHWNRRIHLLEYLAREANYPHSYMGIHNRREGRLPLAYGNGILSRHLWKTRTLMPSVRHLLAKRAFFIARLHYPEVTCR